MSDIKNNKKDDALLLVWITNPLAAGRIVSCAKKFADENRLVLKVVSVQNETRGNWNDTLRDLEQLETAAKASDAGLTVVYSDDRIEAAKKLVRSEKPYAMFAGVSDKGGPNYFADTLRLEFPGVKLYCVDTGGEVKEYERTL